jgi:hypothetical protein
MKTLKLAEAPNYDMSEDGTITNRLTKLPVTANKGTVRLTVNGERKAFKVDVLKERYFQTAKPKATADDKPKAADKTADKPKATATDKSADKPKAADKGKNKAADKPKEVKKAKSNLSNHKKLDKKFFDKVRADYDKDPAKFDINAYATKHDVSYGRIWSVIKLHKAKLATDATKNKKGADKPAADKPTASDKPATDKKSNKKSKKNAKK